MKDSILGIDLGTTYSCASYYNTRTKKVELIKNFDGKILTPSIVYFDESEIVIGERANQIFKESSSKEILSCIVYSSKKNMGEDKKYKIRDKEYTAENIASLILGYIKSYSELYTGIEFKRVIVTVPAYFEDNKRNSTRRSALEAGFEKVEKIINEPTSAGLAYGYNTKDKVDTEIEIALVMDIGGGTTDFSLIEMDKSLDVYQVINTHGDLKLGGDNFTKVLVDYTMDEIKSKYTRIYKEIEKSEYRYLKVKTRLKKECEEIKKGLTYKNSLDLYMDALYNDLDIKLNITKSRFEKESKELLERLECMLDFIIKDSIERDILDISMLNSVLFIGGSTRLPCVKEMVIEYFRKKHNKNIKINDSLDPDTTVCYGAGVQAYILDDTIEEKEYNPTLFDIVPLSIGIELDGGIFGQIITRGETLPANQSMEFTTSITNISQLNIDVYQGERRFCKDNVYLGSFTVRNISVAMKGQIIIIVEISVDTSGEHVITGYEKKREKETKSMIKIKKLEGISESSIKELIKNADSYKFIDLIESKKKEIKIRLYDKFMELLEIFQDREDILLKENINNYKNSYKALRFNSIFNDTWSIIVEYNKYSVIELEKYSSDFSKKFYEALFEISKYDLIDSTEYSTELLGDN